MLTNFTPSERLIKLSLALVPGQTLAQLQQSIAAKTREYLVRTLRTLEMAGLIRSDAGLDGNCRYFSTEVIK
jgi:hypothetical protein